MNDEEMIYCSRCGEAMKASSRYCMKCGNLNYDHPENRNMQQYIANNDNTYQVGSGNFLMGNGNNQQVVQSIANNTGNNNLCFYLTFFLYLISIIIPFFSVVLNRGFNFFEIANSIFPFMAIILSITFFYLYSIELLFMKANKRWWASLIPVYNIMILSEMAFNKKIFGLVSLIPVIGIIYIFILFYKIGEKFKCSGILTMLFPIIMIPVIAYGSYLFEGRTFVNYDVKNSVEIDYKRKKLFLVVSLLFFIIGLGLLVYNNLLSSGKSNIDDYYYVYAARKMVNKTKDAIDNNKINCDNLESNDGSYYVYMSDVGDELNLFLQILRDPIEGYVKVVKTDSGTKYYVSLTDGIKGFFETEIDKIDIDTVVDYKKLNNINKSLKCFLS